MEEHAFRRIVNDIRDRRLGRLVLLYGREHYLIEWARKEIIGAFTEPSSRMMDLSVFTDEHLVDEEIMNSVETLPVMSERKITEVSFHSKKALADTGIFDIDVPETSILLVTAFTADVGAKTVKKADFEYDFSALERKDLMNFVAREIKKTGKTISQANLREYVELSGYYHRDSEYTLYDISGDILKLKAYAAGEEITRDDIAEVTGGNVENNVFRLVDALSSGNTEEAFNLLGNLFSLNVSVQYILSIIASQYEDILMVKDLFFSGYDRKYVRSKFKSDYRFRKIASLIDRFSFEDLKRILRKIYHVEYDIKGGKIEEKLALEVLIGEI